MPQRTRSYSDKNNPDLLLFITGSCCARGIEDKGDLANLNAVHAKTQRECRKEREEILTKNNLDLLLFTTGSCCARGIEDKGDLANLKCSSSRDAKGMLQRTRRDSEKIK